MSMAVMCTFTAAATCIAAAVGIMAAVADTTAAVAGTTAAVADTIASSHCKGPDPAASDRGPFS
jgi:hypothetical protein